MSLESRQAFDRAIEQGRLSADETVDNWAGHYMYMGNTKTDFGKPEDKDLFKHHDTRRYIE